MTAYAALCCAALLAWRFHNARLFTATLLLGASFAARDATILSGSELANLLFATFLPLGIALLTVPSDRGFRWTRVWQHLAVALAPLGTAAFFSAPDPARAITWLSSDTLDSRFSAWSNLPQPALLVLTAALVTALTVTMLRRRAVEAGLTGATVAAAFSVAAPAGSPAHALATAGGALVLIAAVIETAYALAFRDELTGLPGRRALAQMLQKLRAPYAIAIVDVDHFKSFNDRHGHDVGDQVLRMVAARLRRVQGGGTAFRSGGEEFTIVFPGLGKRAARPHVEALRASIAEARFVVRELPRPRGRSAQEKRGRRVTGTPLNVTISVGVASPSARYSSIEAVLQQADKAMYRAKSEGRNRVVA